MMLRLGLSDGRRPRFAGVLRKKEPSATNCSNVLSRGLYFGSAGVSMESPLYCGAMLFTYLRMLGRRAIRWGTGGAITVVFFFGAALAGLPQWAVLLVGVIGAIVGSLIAQRLMLRLFGAEPPPTPPPPRGRGSGKRGS